MIVGVEAGIVLPEAVQLVRGWTVATAVATLSITGLVAGKLYELLLRAASNSQDALWFARTSADGSTYDAGASDYCWSATRVNNAGVANPAGDNADAQIVMFLAAAVTLPRVNARIVLDPSGGSLDYDGSFRFGADDTQLMIGAGDRIGGGVPYSAFRLAVSAGTFSCRYKLVEL